MLAAQRLGLNVVLYDPGLTLADIDTDGITPNAGGWAKLATAYQTATIAYWQQLLHPEPARPNPR